MIRVGDKVKPKGKDYGDRIFTIESAVPLHQGILLICVETYEDDYDELYNYSFMDRDVELAHIYDDEDWL